MWSSGASTLYVLEDDMMISEFVKVEGDNMRIDLGLVSEIETHST